MSEIACLKLAVSHREFVHVIAGLRNFRGNFMDPAQYVEDSDHEPLTADELEQLCQRLFCDYVASDDDHSAAGVCRFCSKPVAGCECESGGMCRHCNNDCPDCVCASEAVETFDKEPQS